MNKIPVYFMPGLAANSKIFERIILPEDRFESYYIEWLIPLENETLENYTLRIAKNIKHENPVLIGVSFGGVIVQELKKIIPVRKTIVISSIRSKREFPLTMKFAKYTGAHKLLPTKWIYQIEEALIKMSNNKEQRLINLYRKYLPVRDSNYLDWSVDNIVKWNREEIDEEVIHIQGDKDQVFPIENITNAIVVKGGTHAMIIFKYKWFNKYLSNIILDEKIEQNN